jgi:hypothetical protein
LRLGRPVALKMLLAGAHAGPTELARFQREADTVASVSAGNKPKAYGVLRASVTSPAASIWGKSAGPLAPMRLNLVLLHDRAFQERSPHSRRTCFTCHLLNWSSLAILM